MTLKPKGFTGEIQGKTGKQVVIPLERIESQIFLIRGHKVMLSTHLAELYEVEPRALVQAVKRNIARFPEDFMFPLSTEEFANLKSQIVISSWGGSRRAAPYAFSEQGVAMLSSVLRSQRWRHRHSRLVGNCGIFEREMAVAIGPALGRQRARAGALAGSVRTAIPQQREALIAAGAPVAKTSFGLPESRKGIQSK